MLKDTDINEYIIAFKSASTSNIAPGGLQEILHATDGMYSAEIWRLACSLEIAAALGDVPYEAAATAKFIHQNIGETRCTPVSNIDAWARAIAWALAHPEFADQNSGDRLKREREQIVGAACLRLRKRGHKIKVMAYGPEIDSLSRKEIIRSIESFIKLLGGVEAATQILRFMRDANYYHDGMWLFGEVGLNLYDHKRPMMPVGWLFSLALRNLSHIGRARKPEIAWRSLVDLATDFAAIHDCQRYSQFDGIDLHPTQLQRTLAISILWREFFTLPQMPPQTIPKVLSIIPTFIEDEDAKHLGFSVKNLISEIIQLQNWSSHDRLTTYPLKEIERSLPLLCQITGGAAKAVNTHYDDPLSAPARTQDNNLLFECGREQACTLPKSLLSAASCNFVFELLWRRLGKRAERIVGKTLERAVEIACTGKSTTLLPGIKYKVERSCYEFDVATRDGDQISLFEVKGKAITSQSRSGDIFKFLDDYQKSFLYILSQLAQHEINLRNGQTPLTRAGEETKDFRPLKIAVSPLSYGPVSDKSLANSLVRSLFGTKLTLVTPDIENQKIIDAFNKRAKELTDKIINLASTKEEQGDIFAYLIDVFWLDIGQLLYVLDRADNIWDAFRPLKHITFSSRDFWTELAHADRGKLTVGKWRQVT